MEDLNKLRVDFKILRFDNERTRITETFTKHIERGYLKNALLRQKKRMGIISLKYRINDGEWIGYE